jgi:hypothetical protein
MGFVIHRGGLDLYEPDDRETMLARFAELTTPRRPVFGESPVELLWQAANRTFNEHDFDAHLAQHAPDFVLTDHRTLGWGVVYGREALMEHVRAALRSSDDVRSEPEELIACDGDRVIAVRAPWRSGGGRTAGAWEIPVAYVTVFEDGLIKSHDIFDADDRDAILARYAELAEREKPMPLRVLERYARACQALDVDGALACMREDWTCADHRSIALWGEISGRAGWEAQLRPLMDLLRRDWEQPTVEYPEILACDETVTAILVRFTGRDSRGGTYEILMGGVCMFADELWVRAELFDPDDRDAILARYAELTAG